MGQFVGISARSMECASPVPLQSLVVGDALHRNKSSLVHVPAKGQVPVSPGRVDSNTWTSMYLSRVLHAAQKGGLHG